VTQVGSRSRYKPPGLKPEAVLRDEMLEFGKHKRMGRNQADGEMATLTDFGHSRRYVCNLP
jgi:hypothetical protein